MWDCARSLWDLSGFKGPQCLELDCRGDRAVCCLHFLYFPIAALSWGLIFLGYHYTLRLCAAIVRCLLLFGSTGSSVAWSWKLQCPKKESPMAWFRFDNPRLNAGLQSFVFFFPALISAWLSRHIFGT